MPPGSFHSTLSMSCKNPVCSVFTEYSSIDIFGGFTVNLENQKISLGKQILFSSVLQTLKHFHFLMRFTSKIHKGWKRSLRSTINPCPPCPLTTSLRATSPSFLKRPGTAITSAFVPEPTCCHRPQNGRSSTSRPFLAFYWAIHCPSSERRR